MSRDSVLPKAEENRKSPSASAMMSRSARVATLMLVSAWARSSAESWVKWTTYTGVWPVSMSCSSVSWTGEVTYSLTSGTGRSVELTTVVSRPVRRARSASNVEVSPSVADISRNWARGSSISGTCQAHPRSGSA